MQNKIGLGHCESLTDDWNSSNFSTTVGKVELSWLTFDLQADLILRRTQHAAGHAGIGAFVFGAGSLDLQGAVDVDAVLATV